MPRVLSKPQTRMDGDSQQVKDYDSKQADGQKKKFTHFYTKQELDQIQNLKNRNTNNVNPTSTQGNSIKPNSSTGESAQVGHTTIRPSQVNLKDQSDNRKSTLTKKPTGGVDLNDQLFFSYLQGNGLGTEMLGKDKSNQIKQKEGQRSKQNPQHAEAPAYFTNAELRGLQENNNQATHKKHQIFEDCSTMSQAQENRLLQSPPPKSKFQCFSKNEQPQFLITPNGADHNDSNMMFNEEKNFIHKISSPQPYSNYSRLQNGMGVASDREEMLRYNNMIAKTDAKLAQANQDKEIQLPMSMQDCKSMSEFYSELLSYAPSILNEAVHKGEPFERFKLALKFAFSILHNQTLQDVFQQRPLVPIIGETYEGHYILKNVTNIYTETDYISYIFKDLLTLANVSIGNEDGTTYILIEGDKKHFIVCGHLTYQQSWKGNNMIIKLLGTLQVRFADLEGEDQVIDIQLPDFVVSGYIYVGKPRTVLIDGPLVLQDKSNSLKAVVKFSGLLKQNNLCGAEFIANSNQSKNIVQGLIYKYNQKIIEQHIKKKKTRKVEKITDLFDIDYKLQRITGSAIDFYEIEGAPHGDWFNVPLADPIPQELGLPSDVRFREDLIWMKRGDKGKGKVWKGMMKEQQLKDAKKMQKKPSSAAPAALTATRKPIKTLK